jgi:hypothetical protein
MKGDLIITIIEGELGSENQSAQGNLQPTNAELMKFQK